MQYRQVALARDFSAGAVLEAPAGDRGNHGQPHTRVRAPHQSPIGQDPNSGGRPGRHRPRLHLSASRNITSAAGVSTSLLFYHYASLEECLIDAVDTSVQQIGERLEIALAGVTDPVDRARLLVEWNLPSSPTERREWLLSFEFVGRRPGAERGTRGRSPVQPVAPVPALRQRILRNRHRHAPPPTLPPWRTGCWAWPRG